MLVWFLLHDWCVGLEIKHFGATCISTDAQLSADAVQSSKATVLFISSAAVVLGDSSGRLSAMRAQ
jgi:hypothetical protein